MPLLTRAQLRIANALNNRTLRIPAYVGVCAGRRAACRQGNVATVIRDSAAVELALSLAKQAGAVGAGGSSPAYELKNSLWFNGKKFQPRTACVANGRLTFRRTESDRPSQLRRDSSAWRWAQPPCGAEVELHPPVRVRVHPGRGWRCATPTSKTD